MTETVIRSALNEGVLHRAASARSAGNYEEALEFIITVLAVDPQCTRAHLEHVATALAFLGDADVQAKFLLPSDHAKLQSEIATLTGKFEGISELALVGLVSDDWQKHFSAASIKHLLMLTRLYARDTEQKAGLQRNAVLYKIRPNLIGFINRYDLRVSVWNAMKPHSGQLYTLMKTQLDLIYRGDVIRMGPDLARAHMTELLNGLAAEFNIGNIVQTVQRAEKKAGEE